MRKRILGTTIIVVWIAMVGWKARDEYFQPELMRLAEAALTLAPGINFYTLTMNDVPLVRGQRRSHPHYPCYMAPPPCWNPENPVGRILITG